MCCGVKCLTYFSLIIVLLATIPYLISSPNIKSDEYVEIHRTYGILSQSEGEGENETQWKVFIQGVVYEDTTASLWYSHLVDQIGKYINVNDTNIDIFTKRIHHFLRDGESHKLLKFKIYDREGGYQVKELATTSGYDGRFRDFITLSYSLKDPQTPEVVKIEVLLTEEDSRIFSGEITLYPAGEGVSVISDIDDTIKITNILIPAQVIVNTFLGEFRPVPRMADLYRSWQKQGITGFHYLSGSPWELFVDLKDFIKRCRFPEGSFWLRGYKDFFRLSAQFLRQWISMPDEFKVNAIVNMVMDFKDRKFILVGDAGERDPEVYGIATRRLKEQILCIFIRKIELSDASEKRFEAAFEGIPSSQWYVFEDPAEIMSISFENMQNRQCRPVAS